MLGYYLEKGITPEYILSLPSVNRQYYAAWYEIQCEETDKAMKKMG